MQVPIIFLVVVLYLGPLSWTAMSGCTNNNTPASSQPSLDDKSPTDPNSPGELEKILVKMRDATQQLNSCQAKLSYLFIQDPDLLDSRTLQTGMLYYQKNENGSQLRIRFDTVKQDDFEPENQRQEYLFDGVWLTRIDFKLKQVDRRQQAPEDKPIGVFELITHNFPLVGFSNIDQLREDFDIQLPKESGTSNESIHLLLNVKKGSKYEKEYKKIDFWMAPDSYLPERIVAYSAQNDVYDITFSGLQVNKNLKKGVFTIETPPDFRKNIERLEEKPTTKGNNGNG